MDINVAFDFEKVVKIDGLIWNKFKFWIKVKENALTTRFMRQIRELDNKPEDTSTLLSEVVTDWNLTAEKKAYPLDFDNIDRLPLVFQVYLIQEIATVIAGNVQAPSGSLNGSARSARSTTRRPSTSK